ncbi:MAG: hypothetical protein IJ637_02450 [Prevotella sp.]|nr:hypothetical protein [Prevotella sp.]
MKKIVFSMMAAVMMMAAVGCGNKSKAVPFDNGDSLSALEADSTIYGICGEATAMNTLQLITDMGDTLTLDLTPAKERNKMFGGLHVGDRMAVIPNPDKTQATMVVNQATLMGNWVMPNPIDGSDEVGISIKEGGIAESIDQSSINYKTWRLTKGKLEIVLVREGGSEDDELYIYDLVKLGPDSLVYKDAEDTYEYSRQKAHEQYGKNVKLEESSFDSDFQM